MASALIDFLFLLIIASTGCEGMDPKTESLFFELNYLIE